MNNLLENTLQKAYESIANLCRVFFSVWLVFLIMNGAYINVLYVFFGDDSN